MNLGCVQMGLTGQTKKELVITFFSLTMTTDLQVREEQTLVSFPLII